MARILVVEDSRTQAMQIQLLLEEAGFEVSHTHHGGEALDALKESLPDVVLTDLDMPVMNGLELVEAVRRDYPAVPVILMTAAPGSEEIAVQAAFRKAHDELHPEASCKRSWSPRWRVSSVWLAPANKRSVP